MNLTDIGREAHEINAANGWETFMQKSWPLSTNDKDNTADKVRFLCTHLALIHSEVSEALEAVRKRDRENFDEELADVVIRVLSVAYGLGTDLDAVVTAKLAKNRKRGLHHGGKAV